MRLMDGKHLPVTFGTFHGIYYGILKWAYRLNSDHILSEEEKNGLIKEAAGQVECELEIDDEKEFLSGIASEIGMIKNNRIDLEEFTSSQCPAHVFRQIYQEYERMRNQRRKLDFDDMLVLCYDLFVKRPDILQKMAGTLHIYFDR